MKKLLTLFATTLMALGALAGELTVADGTEQNASLPVCSYYFDTDFHSQMLYDVAEIESAKGKINSLTFYSASAEQAWGAGTVSVKLAEVTETAMTTTPLTPEFTEVYNGTCSIIGGELLIEFTIPFDYSGEKNLLVEIKKVNKGSAPWSDTYFYGKEVTAASYTSREKQGTYTYAANVVNFLPKTTFAFDGAGGSTCARPTQVGCTATPDGGIFTWKGEEGGQYQYCAVEADQEATGWQLLDAGKLTCTISGLTAGKAYDFHVRRYCSESEQSADAKIAFTPVCNSPANVKMAELTHNSVTMSWDAVAGINAYQYICVRKGAEFEWTGVEAKAGLSAKLEGLEAQTSYDFYVRSWFSESTQSEATKLSFTTNCVAATMPFTEDFEEAEGLPSCWESNLYGDGGNAWSIGQWYKGDQQIYAARYYARSSSWTPADLKTAAIELSEHALLKFAYKNDVTAEVLIFDGSEETELLSVPQSDWTDATIDLGAYTGKIVNIIFRGHSVSNASKYFYVDDIQVVAKPCEQPANLTVSASQDGALVSWKAGEDETVWNLHYRVKDTEDWTEVKELTETTYSITNLTTGTEYEVQVQAACAADKLSGWTDSELFTPQCPKPERVTVKNVTDNSAIITWESAESAFILEYKTSDAEDWTKVQNVQGLTYTLTGLLASTAYKVRLQAACEGEYSGTRSFTTKCAPLIGALPLSEDFEDVAAGSLPDCWERRSETMSPAVEATTAARGADEETKLNCLSFQAENEQLLILPAIGDDLSEYTLSFYHRVNSSDANMELGYLTELYGDFVALVTLDNSNYEYNAPVRLDLAQLPAAAKYIAIRYTATSGWTKAFIDDVQIAKTSEITAIGNTTVKAAATKRIVNGQLVIEVGGEQYNAQGVSVK